MHIGLTYDLREDYLAAGYDEIETAEFDRPDTIDAIEDALTSLGHACQRIGNVRDLAARLVAGERWDLVFNICEGLNGYGREAQVPALLEAYDIPCVFSDTLVCALTLHKAMTKHVLRDHGLPTPEFALVRSPTDIRNVAVEAPWFVKPVAEGTSKGITAASMVHTRSELRRQCLALLNAYHQPVLVETFLPGREFTVGIVGTGSAATALGILEVKLKAAPEAGVYSYESKEHCEELIEYRLLREAALGAQLERLALAAWRVIGCRDAGRVDLRLDRHGGAHVLEINPLAGLNPGHSDLPIICSLAGIGYVKLIERILASALQRVKAGRATIAA